MKGTFFRVFPHGAKNSQSRHDNTALHDNSAYVIVRDWSYSG
jgi:hypothetical protein